MISPQQFSEFFDKGAKRMNREVLHYRIEAAEPHWPSDAAHIHLQMPTVMNPTEFTVFVILLAALALVALVACDDDQWPPV
jgi:hypothetical protein